MAVLLHRRPHAISDIFEVSTGEETFDSGNTLNVSIPALIRNKSVLIFTYKSDDTTWDDNENRVSGQLTSTTNLQFKVKASNTHTKTIKWYIIHYRVSSPVQVHRGSHSMSGTSDNITVPAVTLANTFLINSLTNDSAGDSSAMEVRYDLTTTTNIAIDCAVDNNQVIEWQAIDHPNYDVQKIAVQIAAASSVGNTAVIAVAEADMWITGGYRSSNSVVDANSFGTWFPISTTSIRVRRTDTIGTLDAILYVVDGNGAWVTDHDRSEIANGNTTKDRAVTTLNDINRAIPFSGSVGGGWLDNNTEGAGAMDKQQAMLSYTSTTNLRTERVGTTSAMRFANQSIDFSPSF